MKIPAAVLEGSVCPLKRTATVVQVAVPQNTIHENALLDGKCLVLNRRILVFLHVAPLVAKYRIIGVKIMDSVKLRDLSGAELSRQLIETATTSSNILFSIFTNDSVGY